MTGGGSGLGAEVAAQLAQTGAKVAVLDVNYVAASEVASRIGGCAIACDVTDTDQVIAALAEANTKNGAARILVNCAGIGIAKRILGKDGPMPLGDFERVVRVNLIGTFNMLRLASAEMSRLSPLIDGERGVIVSIRRARASAIWYPCHGHCARAISHAAATELAERSAGKPCGVHPVSEASGNASRVRRFGSRMRAKYVPQW